MKGSTGIRRYPEVRTDGIDEVAKSNMNVFLGTFVDFGYNCNDSTSLSDSMEGFNNFFFLLMS